MIIGCDFHTRQQQIAMLDSETGEVVERRLAHENGEVQKFYQSLAKPVRVGIEATGYTQWFEQMLAKLGHELWVGDAAAIRASVVRRQKTDKRDAAHILDLLVGLISVWIFSSFNWIERLFMSGASDSSAYHEKLYRRDAEGAEKDENMCCAYGASSGARN